MKGYLLLTVGLFCVVFSVKAQKLGHVNYDQLIVNAPGIQAVDAQLKSYQDSLTLIFQQAEKELIDKYQPLQEQADQGLLPPKDLVQIQREYEIEEQRLAQMGQDFENMILQRRQKLLLPMIMKIDEVIIALAKEEGHMYIFDSGAAGYGYYPEADDLYGKILARLEY